MFLLIILSQFPNIRVNDGPGYYGTFGTGPTFGSGGRTSFAYGGKYYLAWMEDISGDDSDIMFSLSTDGGTTWATPTRVGDAGPSDTSDQQYPSIYVQGNGTIYIAYRDWSTGHASVKIARSTDQGASWVVHPVDDVVSNHNMPSVWARNDTVFLAWQDDRFGDFDILYSASTNGGASWSDPVRVNDVATGLQREPSIGVHENWVFVAWSDFRNSGTSAWDIYFARSSDFGATWQANQRLNDDATDEWQVQPSLDVRDGWGTSDGIYVVWVDGRSLSPWHVYITRSTDNGTTWTTNVKVDDLTNQPIGGATKPSVWANDWVTHVVWHDEREGTYNIYYDFDCNGGLNFGSDMRVDYGGGDSRVAPTVTALDGWPLVAWSDNRRTGTLVYDVYAGSAYFCDEVRESFVGETGPVLHWDMRAIAQISWSGRRFDAGIYDPVGRCLASGVFSDRALFDLSREAPGVYLLVAGRRTFKLLKAF
ncbi:MAG: sialidase family protein [candidate division WOR-3 bacterium]